MKPVRAGHPASLTKNLALSALSLLVFLLLAEFLAGTLGPGRQGPRAGITDAITGFRLRPGHTYTEVGGAEVRTNSRGFRDGEVPARRPPGGIRVLALGDSSTFGYGVRREETYVERLERSLAARIPDRRLEVINAGTPGWASANGAAFLAGEGLGWKPDLVLVSFGYNEQLASGPGAPHYDYDPARRRVLFHPLGTAVRELVYPRLENLEARAPEGFFARFRDFPTRLRFYALMKSALHGMRQGFGRITGSLKSSDLAARFLRRAYQRDPERIYGSLRVAVAGNHVVESYVENLEAIVELCREGGVPVVFLLQPRRAYREFIDFLPAEDRAANLESIALLRAGKAAEAIAILSPRLAARPRDAITAYHLGVSYYLEGRQEEARRLFEQIVSIRTFTMNALSLMTAGRLGVPVIVTTLPLAAREQRGLYFPDRYHVTAAGYALIAEQVETFLQSEGTLAAMTGGRTGTRPGG